jgi:GST-like protein
MRLESTHAENRRTFMFTLYGFKTSGSAAIEAALVLVGAPYRVIDAATWEPTSALGELGRLNPLGQIPTLVLPDGSILTESAAILIHLGLSYPTANLLPASAAERARSIRGLVYLVANCYAAIGVVDYPERWCLDLDEAFNERLRRGARARLHRYWGIFADTFPARPFLSGTEPGALDLLAAVVSRWSGARPHLKSARPALLATLESIDRQPKIAPVFARHWDS